MNDEIFMRLALEEAQKAFMAGEVPVGAVLVCRGEVIVGAHNEVEKQKDATAHAELLALRRGAIILENWRLKETTLYCTLEPCIMCAGAMIASRIQTLVWGAPDLRQGAHGSWIDLRRYIHPIHQVEVRGGILQEECAALMREFFQKKREKNHVGKTI
jgi:tRNA(adenine34) deaminase